MYPGKQKGNVSLLEQICFIKSDNFHLSCGSWARQSFSFSLSNWHITHRSEMIWLTNFFCFSRKGRNERKHAYLTMFWSLPSRFVKELLGILLYVYEGLWWWCSNWNFLITKCRKKSYLSVNQMVWLFPAHMLSISLSIYLHLYDTNKNEFP